MDGASDDHAAAELASIEASVVDAEECVTEAQPAVTPAESIAGAQAIAALIVAACCLLPPFGFVLAPFAMYRARKALRFAGDGYGTQYAPIAWLSLLLAGLGLLINLIAVAACVWFLL